MVCLASNMMHVWNLKTKKRMPSSSSHSTTVRLSEVIIDHILDKIMHLWVSCVTIKSPLSHWGRQFIFYVEFMTWYNLPPVASATYFKLRIKIVPNLSAVHVRDFCCVLRWQEHHGISHRLVWYHFCKFDLTFFRTSQLLFCSSCLLTQSILSPVSNSELLMITV